MIGTGSVEWREPDPTPIDPESQKLQDVVQELYAGLFCCVVSHIAYRICQLSFFKVVFIASVAFTATSMARKVFEDHTLCRKFELASIQLVQDVPFIKPLISIIATIFYTQVHLLGVTLSLGLGILQGLTNESAKMHYLTEKHRSSSAQKPKLEG